MVRDVFISYSKKDREAVSMLASALTSAGLSVWWDDNLDVSSTAYPRQIWEVLSTAKKVLVVWSLSAVESDWVTGEAEEGRSSGRLVQTRLDGVRLRPPFNLLQTADLSDWRGQPFHAEWMKLVQALGQPAAALRPSLPSLDTLKALETHPLVGVVVGQALERVDAAEKAVITAENCARLADQAAARAASGSLFHKNFVTVDVAFDHWTEDEGYLNPKYHCDVRFAGEFKLGSPDGFCRMEYLSGRSAGDVFRGQRSAGGGTTYAIRDFADNIASMGWLKFRGQGALGPNGPCEITMKNGAKFIGATDDPRKSAIGVFVDAAGVRWTGVFKEWLLNGPGVREDQDGQLPSEWKDSIPVS